jgi:hypothetical protein
VSQREEATPASRQSIIAFIVRSREFDRRPDESGAPPFLVTAVVIGSLCATRFLAMAASPGEIDEAIFAGAVTHFDVFDLSPQAPGFPLWILLGRLLLPIFHSPFTALCAASTFLSALALPALYSWGRRLVGGWAALAGVVFAASLPVIWVNGGKAFSDSPATAFFLISLAFLSAAENRPTSRETHRQQAASGRAVRLLAILAGLAAAAGAGVRPHLVLAFGPVLLLGFVRLAQRGDRHDAAISFVLAGLAGTLAWGAWLLAQVGGFSGLVASVGERASFRSQAFATGSFGNLASSFLARDFLSPRRALLVAALVLVGLYPLAKRMRRSLLDLSLVLVPTFLSLWFLHSRAMSRYSIPLVMVLALLVGRGLQKILRRGSLTLLGAFALAAFFGIQALPEVRWSATAETPPIAAIRFLERFVHPGRDTIVADESFHAFLRLERWEGRLVAWGYLDSEIVSGTRQMNKRVIRLADTTGEAASADRTDMTWTSWSHGGRVAEALGNGRLLSVAVRIPAPPLFGPGFGMKERREGAPSFHWAGSSARLIVPGLEGPPAALLMGERPGDAGSTTIRVVDAFNGSLILTKRIEPGPFDLAIIAPHTIGPLPRPREYLITCDRTSPLAGVASGTRPHEGCFIFLDATSSVPPERLWERQGNRFLLDIGSAQDRNGDPDGFFAREWIDAIATDMRWAGHSSSVVFSPVIGFVPRILAVRARAPSTKPLDVLVRIGGEPAGSLTVLPGGFSVTKLVLPEKAVAAFGGASPVRIEFLSSTYSPKKAGTGADARELGLGVDRIELE